MPIKDFLRLPEAKQDEILNAALKEFSFYGYDLASTNRIVAEAGISKGVLFKYFNNKESLFLFLIKKYLYEFNELSQVKRDYNDLFDYFIAKNNAEDDICDVHPKFRWCFIALNKILNKPDHPVHKKALEYYYSYVDINIDMVMSKLDENRLRDGITPADVREVIVFLINGFRAMTHKDPERTPAETEKLHQVEKLLISVARNGIYK
ncbi:MAG: TetR/AcrR family transcriptional regulator [Chloroflexi bacterium]|nr:TetR/AcrR family transcriptional regulator [Chloroflexota bacterium]